jgi:UDP-3-O-[3-hydroxymyristoyl] glucosamine N-acyltransferase
MSEPKFLRHSRGLGLGEIAALIGAEVPAGPASSRHIVNIAPLERAGPLDLCFFDNRRFAGAAAATHAGACITTTPLSKELPERVAALIVKEPYRAFVAVARELFPHALRPSSLFPVPDMTGAHVHPSARLESDVVIEPGAVIGPDVEIGAGTRIGANAVIGAGVRIGRDGAVGAGCVITDALIGDRVIIHAGCAIGQDGFGYVMGPSGHMKVPQVGRVIIQDDVEIGAGTTVDRGAIRDTVIGEGTKIDNLVQVSHNVSIGRHCVIVAQSGIAGSSTIEDFVVLGARAGISNNVTIGEGAQLAATAGVHADVPPGGRFAGTPAKPAKQWFRELKAVARLGRASHGGRTDENE